MNRACWHAARDSRYVIDVALGGFATPLMLDTGIVDSWNRVGAEIEPVFFDRLKQAGLASGIQERWRTDASGRRSKQEIGEVTAQLIDPVTRARIGPLVRMDVMRNPAKVPSRVGVLFFHRLTGCRVDWDLDNKVWCVEYP